MGYDPKDRELQGARLVQENKLQPPINCSTCHR
jgi:hypothetical protein